jgi:hypothetical protein
MSEPNWSYSAEKWMHRQKTENRREDRYTETVTDPDTGEIGHHVDEPLSKHRGHGSAKKASQNDTTPDHEASNLLGSGWVGLPRTTHRLWHGLAPLILGGIAARSSTQLGDGTQLRGDTHAAPLLRARSGAFALARPPHWSEGPHPLPLWNAAANRETLARVIFLRKVPDGRNVGMEWLPSPPRRERCRWGTAPSLPSKGEGWGPSD